MKNSALQQLAERYNIPFDKRVFSAKAKTDGQITAYQQLIPQLEARLWQDHCPDNELSLYHQIFHELEALIKLKGCDNRHHFIVVMPLADRPQHLQNCLQSLLDLCRNFYYGGLNNENQFAKLSVLIADDSQLDKNIQQHKNIVADFNQKGLKVEYFGLPEQQAQLKQLDKKQQDKLQAITGRYDKNIAGHKGASIMRNITYLRLNEIQAQHHNSLIYFIDSDQAFVINQQSRQGERNIPFLNYFYYLDQIFSRPDVQILTGKVVGDPPVSPAVMAGKFMDDVMSFLKQLEKLDGRGACQFHRQEYKIDEGAYHDMGDLFGLKSTQSSCDYPCTLKGVHTHKDTLKDFARKLNHFFDGEHPTRKSFFEYQKVMEHMPAARTIYTGNYILRPDALKYFIPFAALKLRMAGPVLGRIIKAEIGNGFVSANLPMLHKRTVENLGQSEYRAGVERQDKRVDLSHEFERQYFGDVMLFSMEKLCAESYPEIQPGRDIVMDILQQTEKELLERYHQKHQQLILTISQLKDIVDNQQAWWNQGSSFTDSVKYLQQFVSNMEHNFGSKAQAYQQINNAEHKQQRMQAMCDAILHYPKDREHWQAIL